MRGLQGTKRFPRKAFARHLQELMDCCSEYREHCLQVIADPATGPVLHELAERRSEAADEMYHELDGVSRTLWYLV